MLKSSPPPPHTHGWQVSLENLPLISKVWPLLQVPLWHQERDEMNHFHSEPLDTPSTTPWLGQTPKVIMSSPRQPPRRCRPSPQNCETSGSASLTSLIPLHMAPKDRPCRPHNNAGDPQIQPQHSTGFSKQGPLLSLITRFRVPQRGHYCPLQLGCRTKGAGIQGA